MVFRRRQINLSLGEILIYDDIWFCFSPRTWMGRRVQRRVAQSNWPGSVLQVGIQAYRGEGWRSFAPPPTEIFAKGILFSIFAPPPFLCTPLQVGARSNSRSASYCYRVRTERLSKLFGSLSVHKKKSLVMFQNECTDAGTMRSIEVECNFNIYSFSHSVKIYLAIYRISHKRRPIT